MGRYVIRRLLQMIPVFIGTTFLIFIMVYSLGDPVAAFFQGKAPDPAIAAQIRHQLWLDRPLIVQYLHYMAGVFQLNFGTSFNGTPVTQLMGQAFPTTLKLTTVAFSIELVFGILLGVVSGLRRG
jgi:oligopeptide transport system permease protein